MPLQTGAGGGIQGRRDISRNEYEPPWRFVFERFLGSAGHERQAATEQLYPDFWH